MHSHRSLKKQSGSLLIEGLCAILIFSVGILGIVGLQATSIKQSADAKYRSEASLLANQLIAQMWVSDRTPATLKANFETDGSEYVNWIANITTKNAMPGMTGANAPTVTITLVPATLPTSVSVTIDMKWQSPGETTVHSYQTITQIN